MIYIAIATRELKIWKSLQILLPFAQNANIAEKQLKTHQIMNALNAA